LHVKRFFFACLNFFEHVFFDKTFKSYLITVDIHSSTQPQIIMKNLIFIFTFFLSTVFTTQILSQDEINVFVGKVDFVGEIDGRYIKSDSWQSCNCWVRDDDQYAIGRIPNTGWYVFENSSCPVPLTTKLPYKYGKFSSVTDCDPSKINESLIEL